MSNKTAEELAADSSAPGTFSFAERLRGRNYAKDSVSIYIDEKLGYELAELELQYRDDAANLSLDQINKLEADITAKIAELKPHEYVFDLEGISNKQYNALVDQANEKFPLEYEEGTDFLGQKTKTLLESSDRDEFFTGILWLACFRKITAADGTTADDINPELIAEFRDSAPLAALSQINKTINKLRLATDWIEYTEDEDFLVKP